MHSGASVPGFALTWALSLRETKETILKAYPYIEAEDIDEALQYAAFLAEEETVEFSR